MKAKYLGYIIILATGLFITACEEYQEENFSFDNSVAAYVELSDGDAIELDTSGITIPIEVQIRVAMENNVTIEYELVGDITTSGSVMIPATELSNDIVVEIPNEGPGAATLTLTSVDNDLSLGRGGPDSGLSSTSVDISWTP